MERIDLLDEGLKKQNYSSCILENCLTIIVPNYIYILVIATDIESQ